MLVPLMLPVFGRVDVAEGIGFSLIRTASGGAVGGRRTWLEPEPAEAEINLKTAKEDTNSKTSGQNTISKKI